MKALILLAVVCTALADHHGDHDMHEHGPRDPCLKACRDQAKSKMPADSPLKMGGEKWRTAEGRTQLRHHMREYINGNAPILPRGETVDWNQMCTIATEAETCIDHCTNAPADEKDMGKKFLHTMKLGCNADFKSSIHCLRDVFKVKSESCQTKCVPVAHKWVEFLDQRDANPAEHVHPPKDVLQSMCNFINCRVFCRKPEVIAKCQDKGFEEAKVFVASLSTTKKMMYKRHGGDMNNWPTECESNKIVDHAFTP